MTVTREQIGAEIIATAQRFVGLQETRANAEWDNPSTAGRDAAAEELRRVLKVAGWQMGWPYCAAFVEATWRLAYAALLAPDELQTRIALRLTPSVMQSFQNWRAEINLTPLPGAIFFMQMGKTGKGHAGLVVRSAGETFSTIEGNTSPQAGTADADREGDGIFRKVRRLDFSERTGLWLRGFLNPLPW